MGTWNFTYDTLNRLVTAKNTATAPPSAQYANDKGCWSYDAFGNRTQEAMSTTVCTNSPPLTSWASYNIDNQFTATNQATGGVPYDAAGNIQYDGVNTYLYDGEGRICAVAATPIPGFTFMTGYLYDADGTRVAKGNITSWSCDPRVSGFMTINDFVLGLGGEQVTEVGVDANNSLAWQHTNVWAGGTLLATYDNDSLHFYLDDPLGTRRVQTDSAGVVEQSCASLPFGDGESCAPTPTEHLFTGKERDTESGNDYFGARYYTSSMGRFMSPDWSVKEEPVPYAKLDNPQSLNLYAYVRNNPVAGVDADGHCGNNDVSCDGAGHSATFQAGDELNLGENPVLGGSAQQQMGDPTLPTAEAPPLLSNQDIAGLKTGTEFALTVGVPEVGELGVAGKALSEAGELEKAGEALLTRYGTKVESTLEKLAGDAAKAEEKIGIHGVSTTSMPKPTLPGGSAPMSAVQKAFNVFKTGGPGHFTVELPKPVTDTVVQIFNSLFFK